VAFQDAARSNARQFTFACDGSLGTRLPNADAWHVHGNRAGGPAQRSRSGLATHYHADYVVPRWRDSMARWHKSAPISFTAGLDISTVGFRATEQVTVSHA
jgi:spore germination cell wall hydrolase CwlJ-like protein